MVRLVALAAIDRLEEGFLGRFHAAAARHVAGAVRRQILLGGHRTAFGIQGGELQQLVRPGRRVIDVLVRQRHVLQDREKAVLALHALGQLRDRIQARERMQRAAVMAGREVRGARHRERRRSQHGLRRHPFTQLVQGRSRISLGGVSSINRTNGSMASEKWTRSGMLNSPSVWFKCCHVWFAGFTRCALSPRKGEAGRLRVWVQVRAL